MPTKNPSAKNDQRYNRADRKVRELLRQGIASKEPPRCPRCHRIHNPVGNCPKVRAS